MGKPEKEIKRIFVRIKVLGNFHFIYEASHISDES